MSGGVPLWRSDFVECLEDCLCDPGEAGHPKSLEQARSKLLLAIAPRGHSLIVELGTRFDLWEKGYIRELLIRIEEQNAERIYWRRRIRKVNSSARLERVKRMAREGAYRKAITTLTSPWQIWIQSIRRNGRRSYCRGAHAQITLYLALPRPWSKLILRRYSGHSMAFALQHYRPLGPVDVVPNTCAKLWLPALARSPIAYPRPFLHLS